MSGTDIQKHKRELRPILSRSSRLCFLMSVPDMYCQRSEVRDQWTDIRVQGSAYYTHPSSFIPHPFLKSLWNQRPRQKPAAALISRLGPGCFLVVSSVLSITSPMVVSRTDWIFSAA